MDISKQNLLLVGFVIIAVVSGWLSFKQACVVDAMGDVASLRADISELRNDISELKSEEKPDEEKIKELEEEIKETERRIPAHSAKPPVMEDLFHLEDEKALLIQKLKVLE